MTKKTATLILRPRLRVLRGKEIVLGPGKADLLARIAERGNLRQAAADLGMSYMRAWKLVQSMNAAFLEPVVETARGGPHHGSARLTKGGATALAAYREMERRSFAASGAAFRRLKRLLAG
ncbi:MAG: LysR family transcriptional regulator [Acidobacteriota bacterium]|nr:LysR family transcriptional regulator [Acidobacteriota bacterium]